MRRTLLVLAVCVAASPALPAVGAPPARPASFDDKTVQAWITANLRADGWTLISADDVAVTLGGPDGVAVLESGLLRARIRREYYGPDRLGPNDTRSNLQTWEVDCATKTFGLSEMSIFEGANLTGASETRRWPEVTFGPPSENSENAKALARICDAPKTGKARAQAVGPTDPALGQPPGGAASGDFAVQQIATTEPGRLMANWNQAAAGVNLPTATEAAHGQDIVTFILFKGCRADASGNCNVTADFETIGPRGRVYDSRRAAEVWVGRPPPGPSLQLSMAGYGLVMDPEDPSGAYRVRASITDHVAGIALTTEEVLTITP